MWYLTVQSDSAGTNETGTAGRLGGYYLRRGNLLSSWCNPTILHPTLDILLVLVSTSTRLSIVGSLLHIFLSPLLTGSIGKTSIRESNVKQEFALASTTGLDITILND